MDKKKKIATKNVSTKFAAASAWDKISPAEEKELQNYAKRYMDFLGTCKTERETIDYLIEKAQRNGFKPIDGGQAAGSLKPGSKVYWVSKNRALCIAVIGKQPISDGFKIVAAHHDVPHLDLKALPLYEKHKLAFLKTHYYGGIKKFHWCAIPLALHCFLITKSGKHLSFSIGEKPNDPVFTITDLPPHLSYKIQNDRKATEVFKAEELNILAANRPKPAKGDEKIEEPVKAAVLEKLQKEYGIQEEDLAWAEIAAVPAFSPREVGFQGDMIGGFGHDDRACVMAAFEAINEVKVPENTAVVILIDKEEVGSGGASGAQSMMVPDFLCLLVEATTRVSSYSFLRKVLGASMVLSADTNAPIDPNFEAAWDAQNSGLLGSGVWICKFTGSAGKSGSSEADVEFIARIRNLLTAGKIPYQFGEMGKVDEGGGGTVAKFFAQLNMHVLDLSLPVLGLHSPFEVLSKIDYHYTVKAYKAFLEKKF